MIIQYTMTLIGKVNERLETGTFKVDMKQGTVAILTNQTNSLLNHYMRTFPGTETAILHTYTTAQPQEAALAFYAGELTVIPTACGYVSFCDLDFIPTH